MKNDESIIIKHTNTSSFSRCCWKETKRRIYFKNRKRKIEREKHTIRKKEKKGKEGEEKRGRGGKKKRQKENKEKKV